MNKHRFQNRSMIAYTFVLIVLAFLVYQVGAIASRIETLEYVTSMHSNYNSTIARRNFLNQNNESFNASNDK